MTPTLQNFRQRARLVHCSSLYRLVSILILVSGVLGVPQLAEATEVAEATDLAWQPTKCRADVAVADSNTTISNAPVFVNATLAREVLQTPGTGRLQINSLQRKPLTVHVFRPSQFDSAAGRIWFVMHGTGRDAKRYLKTAAPVAERHRVLLIVLEFSRKDYPTGDAYTLGVVTRGPVAAHAAEEGRWRNPLQTPYMEIERTFSAVKEVLQNKQSGYFIFGHSAGAQFVHRLLSFVRCPRVLKAVAANAGVYTLPTVDKKWPPFPYSLRGASREFQDPGQVLAAPLTVLLGTRDTRGKEEDTNLRGTEGAIVQGANRLQRGMTYYKVGQQAAHSANRPFAWKVQLVPGAGHEVAQVIAPAGQLLFVP